MTSWQITSSRLFGIAYSIYTANLLQILHHPNSEYAPFMVTGTQSAFSPITYIGNQRITHIESVQPKVYVVVLPRGQEILLCEAVRYLC